ncbi:MAG: radical SAM protein [Spirochaetes bacterium]|nr:radical SAM protein [Spirochaetota bacterium]
MKTDSALHHIDRQDWLITPDDNPRGYIQPESIKELWFHTGTVCNLRCPFCLEGSKPGDNRINPILFEDAKPFIDEALELGVKQHSFTGGEPFVVKDTVKIIYYALKHRPCLVLTNATEPLLNRMQEIIKLKDNPNSLSFRVSLDHPDPVKHDESRGKGNFNLALKVLAKLHQNGFKVSLARLTLPGEDPNETNKAYHPFLKEAGLPLDIEIVIFPEFHLPGSNPEIPYVTESCMTTYKNEQTRSEFMCNFSKMVLKKNGKMSVYACTLVDDDSDYDLGSNLTDSMKVRVMLKHHRCYSCFASGASCSQLGF